MADDHHAAEPGSPPRWPVRASTLGTVYCVLSAVFYTLMGICQRELSTTADPVWVNCVQASVSTVVFGFYLSFCSLRGRSAWPTWGVALGLMALGVITQLGGSSYQWSLGVVGLAIGNPLQMGVMLAAAALLGWIVLGERVGWRAITAIALITASVLLLSVGAEEASQTISAAKRTKTDVASGGAVADVPAADEAPDKPDVPLLMVLLGVGGACLSGVAFAILTVGMRKTATENTSPEAIVFFINLMGILFLGPWAAARLGLRGMLATSPRDLIVMLAVGLCNLLAFLLIAKALQLTGVVRVNVINNALTTVLTVLAGIVIFAEPAKRELIVGIVLTLAGIVLISTAEAEEAKEANANSAQPGQRGYAGVGSMRERIRVQDIGLDRDEIERRKQFTRDSVARPAARPHPRLRHGREPAAEIHDPRAVSGRGQAVGGSVGGRGPDLEARAGGRHGAGHASRRRLQPAGHCVWRGAVLGRRSEPDLRRQGPAAGRRGAGYELAVPPPDAGQLAEGTAGAPLCRGGRRAHQRLAVGHGGRTERGGRPAGLQPAV